MTVRVFLIQAGSKFIACIQCTCSIRAQVDDCPETFDVEPSLAVHVISSSSRKSLHTISKHENVLMAMPVLNYESARGKSTCLAASRIMDIKD